ncbi:TonB-dependent hemoglobin/transferrin/lactoferrin family receptor [Dechloromonas denitrificans]|uniref:TonB-dependent hemoglobin/transferrin/lactoferrin family receptor n=1 Tax=Dechloromonas denitrificans TaxID=281362 RepID=UPI001CF83110|nr:TonB-dependent hemoglobin/transferrin/lactoferrin family receptor [Dechloromonas denitrificans]UCV10200.1 TonB-dependent hemoglobin/transferrin/lactoferrin family receptor [Dechloromonas denitrificans]
MGYAVVPPHLLKRRYLSVVISLLCAGLSPNVLAEPAATLARSERPGGLQLADVVVSATRTEQDVHDVANTITSISDKRIEQEQAADIKDMLRYESGVSVRSEPNRASGVFRATGRSGNEGINIRGLEGNQVLLQVDGVRLPASYASGPYAAGRGDYIDIEAYKRVEILRGPSSTQFGSDGLAGAVSFLTKDPGDLLTLGKPSQTALKLAYSTVDNSWTTVPSFAYADETVEAMLLASLRRGHETDNKGDNHASNVTRTVPNPQDTQSNYVLGKVVIKPNRNHKIKLTAENLDRQVDTTALSFLGDAYAAAGLNQVALREDITRRLFKLDYDYNNIDNPLFQRMTAALYNQQSENRQWGLEGKSTASSWGTSRWRDTRYAEEVIGGSLQLESNFGEYISHRIIYGMDASTTEVTSLKDGYNSAGAAFVKNKSFPDTDYSLLGAFVQDEIGIGPFSLIPGVRFDSFKMTPKADSLYRVNNTTEPAKLDGREVSPKFGVIWKLDPMANLFAQYAHGFRAPTPTQVNGGVTNLTAADPYTSLGNPELKPETSDSVELGIRGRSQSVRYSASAFRGEYKNFIASNVLVESNAAPTPDVYKTINLSNVEISGYEFRGDWAFHRDWSASASYAHTIGDARQNGVKTPLATIDPDKVVLGLRYDNGQQYGSQLMLTAVERKKRNPDTTSSYNTGGFAILDLTAYYQINKNLTLNGGIFNLFDRKYFLWADVRNQSPTYAQIDAFSQPGRNASLSLKYQF